MMVVHRSVGEGYDPALAEVIFDLFVFHEFEGVEGHSIASCFAGLGGVMNMSGRASASAMRLQATSKYFGSLSIPVNPRPSMAAAAPVVPLPIYGSMIESA